MNFPITSLATIYWNAAPEIITSPIAIRWYGLLFAIGLIGAYYFLTKQFKRLEIPQKTLDSLIFYLIMAAIIGARLGHCLFYEPDVYLSDPLRILNVREGGLSSHGAAVAIVIAMLIFIYKNKGFNFFSLGDLIAVVIPFSGMCIRIGNFINSEIVGKPADLPWSVVFMRNDMIPRHPGQLYEAVAYLILLLILLFFFFKKDMYKKSGFLSGVFLIGMFVARFFIEYFKDVQVDFENSMALHLGQWLSIPFIILGIIMLLYSRNHYNDYAALQTEETEKK